MQANAKVRTEELRMGLDYLDGLLLILEHVHESGADSDISAQLLPLLRGIDADGAGWEPLRYQDGVGMGWHYVAQGVSLLRDLWLKSYAEAAMEPAGNDDP